MVKDFINKNYGLKDFEVKSLDGYIDDLYLVEGKDYKYVFRIFRDERMKERVLERQIEFMEKIFDKGFITCPEVINSLGDKSYEEFEGSFCMMVKFIDGDDLDPNYVDAKFLGDLIGWLHLVGMEFYKEGDFYLDPIKEEENKNKEIKTVDKDFLSFRAEILDEYANVCGDLQKGFLVNDLHYYNIKVVSSKLCVIDFNIAGGGYLIDELAWIMVWYFKELGKDSESFLFAYLKWVSLSEAELEMLSQLVRLYGELQEKNL